VRWWFGCGVAVLLERRDSAVASKRSDQEENDGI
jgi:hypothetical protein